MRNCFVMMYRLFLVWGLVAWGASALARETKKEKEAATSQFREYVQLIGRLGAPGKAETRGTDKERLRSLHAVLAPRLVLPSERKKFDEAFQELEKKTAHASDDKALDATAAYLDNVYRWFKVFLSPAQTPDPKVGREIYASQCATCHGVTGAGDGKLAASQIFKTKTPPTRFNEAAFGKRQSPFLTYNTLMLGIPDTVMPAYMDRLTDHEIWSVAFYVSSLPYGGPSADPVAQWQGEPKAIKDSCLREVVSLADLSRANDRQLAAKAAGAGRAACDLPRLRAMMPFLPSLPRL